MAEILVVDNEPGVVGVVARALQEDGHVVFSAGDGPGGLKEARHRNPDLIILDVNMPGMNGWEVCAAIRRDPLLEGVPVIFLSVANSAADEVEGLDLGANDYVTKPCDLDVLRARVRALLRNDRQQGEQETDTRASVAGIQIEPDSDVAVVNGEQVELTPTEYDLLRTFMSHPEEPLSTEFLLQRVWGYPSDTGEPTLVRRYVHQLRDKIEPHPRDPQRLLTVRNRGYKLSRNHCSEE